MNESAQERQCVPCTLRNTGAATPWGKEFQRVRQIEKLPAREQKRRGAKLRKTMTSEEGKSRPKYGRGRLFAG